MCVQLSLHIEQGAIVEQIEIKINVLSNCVHMFFGCAGNNLLKKYFQGKRTNTMVRSKRSAQIRKAFADIMARRAAREASLVRCNGNFLHEDMQGDFLWHF